MFRLGLGLLHFKILSHQLYFYQACRSSEVEGMFPGGGRGGGPSEAELPYLRPPSMALISHIFLEAIVKLLERYHL